MERMLKYPKVLDITHEALKNITKGEVIIEEKIDGCFSSYTKVILEDGSTLNIGDIVNKKLDVRVLSYNFKTGELEGKRVVNWFKYKKTTDWIRIWTNKSGVNTLYTTPNHIFYVEENGEIIKKKAEDIKEGDKLLLPNYRLDLIERQVILGLVAGDGYIYSNEYGFSKRLTISSKDKDFINFLKKIIDIKWVDDERISGYGTKVYRISSSEPAITEIYDITHINGEKQLNEKWIKGMGIIGLAMMYFSDGSFNKGNGKQRGYAVFHTNRYTIGELELLVDYMNSLGYEAKIRYCRKKSNKEEKVYPYIALSTEGSEKFFTDIMFYTPKCMQYKLPERYRQEKTFWDLDYTKPFSKERLITIKVSKVERVNNKEDYQYDIEVEDNHNYFVSRGYLVSNSQLRVEVDNLKIRIGTKNVDDIAIIEGDELIILKEQNLFLKAIQTIYDLRDRIRETINKHFFSKNEDFKQIYLFGEYLRDKKHNVLAYSRIPKNHIVLFDIITE